MTVTLAAGIFLESPTFVTLTTVVPATLQMETGGRRVIRADA
jgi:hypothetical protein